MTKLNWEIFHSGTIAYGGARAGGKSTVVRALRNGPAGLTDVPAGNVIILALDLGTHTGWASRDRDGRVQHGTENFSPGASWSRGQKWQRFRAWLHERIASSGAQQIAYEDVKRHLGTDAAHAYGGFLAMVEMVAGQHNIPLMGLGVGQIKQHWTGKGNAKKEAMIAEAKRRGFRPRSDNDADALAILDLAVARNVS